MTDEPASAEQSILELAAQLASEALPPGRARLAAQPEPQASLLLEALAASVALQARPEPVC